MRVLLVAPRTDLLMADAEVQRVLRSGLDVVPMLGKVEHQDLLDELDRGEYDALWFATHGSADGILLSDGMLSASLLAPLVRSGTIYLVVLNTCDSVMTAQMLQNETDAEIIATVRSVPDVEAFQTGVLFARALSQTQDTAAAYNIARPGGNRTYVRLAGNGKKK